MAELTAKQAQEFATFEHQRLVFVKRLLDDLVTGKRDAEYVTDIFDGVLKGEFDHNFHKWAEIIEDLYPEHFV